MVQYIIAKHGAIHIVKPFHGLIVKPFHGLTLFPNRPPHPTHNSKSSQNDRSNAWIITKLSGKVPMGILDPPTPTPAPSGTSMSSKTPGRDIDDRCSLDKLPYVGSW